MPKRKPFVCKTCDRSFSMAAHLARHSRVHARKRPKNPRRAVARPSQAPAARTGSFAGLVSSLQSSHRALVAERDTLSAQIAALESAMNAVSGSGVVRNGKAAMRKARDGSAAEYRAGSLKDHVHRVLSKSSTPLPVSEIAASVVRSGFKSKNKTLATTVGIALADMPGVRRVKRGVYGLQ
jgi:hypothetical protein